MSVPIKIECPKCHADRTMLDNCFALTGFSEGKLNPDCALPVRLVVCPRCHLLEMYHDVGLEKPC